MEILKKFQKKIAQFKEQPNVGFVPIEQVNLVQDWNKIGVKPYF